MARDECMMCSNKVPKKHIVCSKKCYDAAKRIGAEVEEHGYPGGKPEVAFKPEKPKKPKKMSVDHARPFKGLPPE